jgi:PKD repeat protein
MEKMGVTNMINWRAADSIGAYAVICNFSASPLFSRPGDTVTFTDLSGNLSNNSPCTFSWDFGDGSPAVFSQNATHIYTHAGNFTVMHTAQGSVNLTKAYRTITYPVGAIVSPLICDASTGNTTGIIDYTLPYAQKWDSAGNCKAPYLCMCLYQAKYACKPNGSAELLSERNPDCCKWCGVGLPAPAPNTAAPNFVVVGVDITPTQFKIGDTITAIVHVQNNGTASGTATVAVTWNDGVLLGDHVSTGLMNVNSTVSVTVSGTVPSYRNTGTYNICAQAYLS